MAQTAFSAWSTFLAVAWFVGNISGCAERDLVFQVFGQPGFSAQKVVAGWQVKPADPRGSRTPRTELFSAGHVSVAG